MPTTLPERVAQVFAPDNVLARVDAHFQPREGQTRMAMAVARTIETGGALVVEAGTGVGKTFSYLVPALLSGERVLLSTATKALQEQLFARDLPRLVETLGLPVRTALLKGRASYLCRYRMELARQDALAQERDIARVLARVQDWSRHTRAGDLAELAGLDERSPVIPLITSTRENCLGSPCPRFRECHVHLARREALAADIVVINHHLFFADVAVRESGMAELLPSVRVVVFDEAHQINETGVQFLGAQLSTGQLLDFGKDLLAAGLQYARGMADWAGLATLVELAARDLRLVAEKTPVGSKLRWTQETPEGVPGAQWQDALRRVAVACTQARDALAMVSEMAPDFVRLHARGSELLAHLARFSDPAPPDAVVRWVDVGAQLRLIESPLDIAVAMRTRVLADPAESESESADGDAQPPAMDPGRAWIFTSATLGEDEQLTWFTQRAGLQDAEILRVASPFDYAAQAALYVPRHLPPPAEPTHSRTLAQWVGDAAEPLCGRTLVLTTTLKALRTIGDALKARFEARDDLQVLVQGEWPKRRLMERFRAGATAGQPGCVLVASATFWEGFDVPGDALQLVVIDKLPFPPPGDPLVEARAQRIEKAGGKAFPSYSLPEAAVALKQGAGRLIRRESDRGILVIGDTRLLTMGYGQRLLAALPPMRRLASEQEFAAALQALRTAP
ncbi:ATP-dependent DNA helicase [Verminephrobacter aporrectodeae subsp. tuberculatae]|uniref:DNA 5'-3' helicase n=1 Tax=Verminephrobacter aporrectodeae subsp. tuberculatae TaxID=1110392 RepID=A0ABT3KUZ7_9BURK|nr:ATP-dependent DNA helicase [Verminephrobacter aporrectodeae]MCW5322157.1 ATP-dependent DNA helicase [Verminephrobacter aporrectodeae subsp. tuberculatae]MCW8167101.1 ATP-dependent DNA helicase [Verminephrobacter aporrectodeae subsp. tuberculatae]MCW8171309.1 ATP-dependent DNA helicase [Verminephrobacter aporrectodeae subsp. tuberculatae]MCW8208038.1 ATP-dependent DNA helicase [Verminephrobacter aporrectodeae subsp. tuberculatae]